MCGYRAIIPFKLRDQLLGEIHGAHMGANKMKSLARQYFWWPGRDKKTEIYARSCNAYKSVAKQPNKSPLITFSAANYVYERIHMDFLGPFKGKTLLVIMDAVSKWPEVFIISKMDTATTLNKLRQTISRFGLPKLIITDNGAQFTSEKFLELCKLNCIQHRTSAP